MPYGTHKLRSNVTGTICLGFGDERNLGDCKILTRPTQGCTGEKAGATLVGPTSGVGYVCRSCGCNAHNAICNRHGAKAPPVTGNFDWFTECFESFEDQLGSMYHEHLEEYGGQWITRWSLGKQKSILMSQKTDPLLPDKVKCMVKRETGHKQPSKARCIQFYWNLATQAEYAPETSSLQKAWCKLFRRFQIDPDNPDMRVTFSSGMNAADLGAWADEALKDYSNPHFYERDGKNWDATMGKPHHDLKIRVYKMTGKEFLDFYQRTSRVKGFGHFGDQILRYVLDYTTKSGHNDTTLGNNIVNAAITCTAFRGMKCDIIIAGDDLLVIVEGDFDENAIAETEKTLGIKPEYRKFKSIEDSSYISGLFAITPQGVRFIARPARMLSCLFWTVKPPSMKPANLRAFQRGVAKGVLPTMQDVPVVGPWLKMIGDEGATIQDRSRRVYTYGSEVRGDFTPWFMRRYGLSQSEIDDLSRVLLEAGAKQVIIRHCALDIIRQVDFADIADRDPTGEF